MTRARQTLLFLGACTLIACGGDDDGIIIADSGPTVDSAPDLCGDYDETSDATNDAFGSFTGTAETSTISFAAGDTKTICGVIDETHYDSAQQVIDIDAFDFEVGPGAPIRAILRAPGAGEDVTLLAILQFVSPEGAVSAGGGGLIDGYGLATSFQAVEGTWRLVVAGLSAAELTAPIEYELEIGNTIPCDAAEGDADYAEARDGAKSKRNDMATAMWGQGLTTAATTIETDMPEPTALTLEADTPVHLTGIAGRRTGADSYRDRDTFEVTMGEGVNEIDFRVTWPDEAMADLDALAFVAGMPDQDVSGGGAAFGGTTLDEIVTTRVGSGAGFWIWVGNYDDGTPTLPMDYDITICPRSFTP